MNKKNKKEQTALVSVIVRTKNRAETLEYALNSVFKQSYKNIEIILVNEGNAFTPKIKKIIANSVMDISLINNVKSLGRCIAGNQGIDASKGEYLIFLDDDDWFNQNHIKQLVSALQIQKQYQVVYSGIRFTKSPKSNTIHEFNSQFDPILLRIENSIPIHALLFSRKLVEHGCRLDESLSVFEDWDLWLQFSQYTNFYHINNISAGYRENGDSGAGWGHDNETVVLNRIKLINKWQHIWSAKQIDEIIQWPKEHWLKELRESNTQLEVALDEKGQVMEDHKLLHETYIDQEKNYQQQEIAHKKLSQLHSNLISNHKILDNSHKKLLDVYEHEVEEHRALGQSLEELEAMHEQLITDHQTLSDIRDEELIDLHRLLRIFTKSQKHFRSLEYQINNGNNQYQKLESEYLKLRNESDEIKNSNIWRKTTLIRHKIIAARNYKNKIVTDIKKFVINNNQVHFWVRKLLNKNKIEKLDINKKIGVMYHVFYVDVFDKTVHYLNHIPCDYQLMMSVTSQSDKIILEKKLSQLNHHAKVSIKVVDNRGRDIAPLLVSFKQQILSLDIVGHIHTKKSNYTGVDTFGDDWRNYLFQKLFDSPEQISKIFGQFDSAADDENKIGIIYPETFSGMPYWAHTWLSNRAQAENLLNRMQIDVDYNQYIDYPVGSMFWAKVDAIKPLYELDLSIDDFPIEDKQTDNTIHHALERCFVLASKKSGYDSLTLQGSTSPFDLKQKSQFVNQNYLYESPYQRIKKVEKAVKVISFDIFDTLYTRVFAAPDAVFWWLESKVKQQFNIDDFLAKRKESEFSLRAQLKIDQDVSISEIYIQMSKLFNLPNLVCKQLQALEESTEQLVLKPRESLKKIIKELKQQKQEKKRLILVSDMYLEKDFLQNLVSQDYPDCFEKIYVSSEIGRRKDRGNIWETVLTEEAVSKQELLHIGDNEHSDIQILVDKQFYSPIHVMRPIAFLGTFEDGKNIISLFRQNTTWENELMLGLIANKVLAFSEENLNHKTVFSDPYNYGYCIMGPIFLVFMRWLYRQIAKDQTDHLLFLSRDGWLLDQLHQNIAKHPKVTRTLPSSEYFYCSRSFLGLSSVKNKKDFNLLLGSHYKGTIRKLLTARFGIEELQPFIDAFDDNVLDRIVSLPNDKEEIEQIFSIIFPSVMKQVDRDKALFLKYWHKQVTEKNKKKPAMVDLGYSGTLQKAMIKILEEPVNGYYFVTNHAAEKIHDMGGTTASCFGHLLPKDTMDDLTMHRYSLILEAIMTSPEGQLKGLEDKNGYISPLFKGKGLSQQVFKSIDKIHEGINQFLLDTVDVLGDDFFNMKVETNDLTELMAMVVNRKIDIGDLSNLFSVEDEFSGNEELNVLDFYDQHYAK